MAGYKNTQSQQSSGGQPKKFTATADGVTLGWTIAEAREILSVTLDGLSQDDYTFSSLTKRLVLPDYPRSGSKLSVIYNP